MRKLIGIVAVLCAVLAPASAQAQDAASFFQQKCTSCHTIGGGRLSGPDLKGLLERQDKSWIQHFMQNPQAVISSGDAYAQKLLAEARAVVMPRIDGMNPEMAAALIELISQESGMEKSRFSGGLLDNRPLTAEDVERGRKLFRGELRLVRGGPACFSCHGSASLGGLGGGRLGPDLGDAFARLGGREALSAWLLNPPSPVMLPVFGKQPLEGEEVLGLVAFLAEEAKTPPGRAAAGGMRFLVLGVVGTGLGLMVMDLAWRRRFRAVRRPLVQGEQA